LRGRNADWAEKAVREEATLTASDALKERVVELIANDVNELLAAIDGRCHNLGRVRLSTRRCVVELRRTEKVVPGHRDPNVVILLLIGMYSVIFEFMSPGPSHQA
jgi:membrane-bound serine protease (ClpP class)